MRAKIEITREDIAKLPVDAIVNAADSSMSGCAGVDEAIRRAAGPELLAECRRLEGCEPGETKITLGYLLPAEWVIHTVGPVWQGGHHGEADVLASCYINSLSLAAQRRAKSIAFPAIGCGAHGYPPLEAAIVAVGAIRAFLKHDTILERVLLCCFTDEVARAFAEALASPMRTTPE
ncbi:MAG: macro domain-containing protein [Opitutaceae bacterium]